MSETEALCHVAAAGERQPVELDRFERQLIAQVRLLRQKRRYCKLLVEWQNGRLETRLWRPMPGK